MARTKKSKPGSKRRAAEKQKGEHNANLSVAETFPLQDLPKELQLRVYELAFEPSGRELSFRVFKNVYNVTPQMPFYHGRRHPPHPLLLVSSTVHKEAARVFYKNADFDVRYYADFAKEDQKWNQKAYKLGAISGCHVFGYIQNLYLQLNLEDFTDLDAYVRGLRQLVKAFHRGKHLARLNVTLHTDWEDVESLNSFQARYVMAALANFACKGKVEIEWYDRAGTEFFQWVPREFRVMAVELTETIML